MSFSNNQSEGNHPRVWAGRAGDPFWIELDVLHAVSYALQDGTTLNLGDYSGPGQESLCLADGLFDGAGSARQELLARRGDSRLRPQW
jgi:hypothetical protein